jgi:hypothetical protein
MNTSFSRLGLGALLLVAGTASAATPLLTKHGFGTVKGTVCIGPISPSSSDGVQIVGSTTGTQRLTWEVYSVSSETADALVFTTTARSVDAVIPPDGNFLYHACVVKSVGRAQAYDLVLSSEEM